MRVKIPSQYFEITYDGNAVDQAIYCESDTNCEIFFRNTNDQSPFNRGVLLSKYALT